MAFIYTVVQLFVHVWTFVMHSRSVLCMTGHYNSMYVCM